MKLILFLLMSFAISVCAQKDLKSVVNGQIPTIPAEQEKVYKEVIKLMDSDADRSLELIGTIKEPSVVFELIKGMIYKKQQKTEAAEASFKKALQTLPSFYQARLNLAYLYLAQKKNKEALPHLLKIVQLGRAGGSVWQNISFCLIEAGKYQAAEEALRQTRIYQDDDRQIDKTLLSLKMMQKDYSSALKLASQLVDTDTQDKQSWKVMIDCQLQLKKHSDALKNMILYSELFESDNNEKNRLAGMYYNEGLYEDAAQIYLKVKGALLAKAKLQSAQCYLLIQEYDKVLKVLMPGTEKYSPSQMSKRHHLRADAFSGLEKAGDALKELLTSLKFETQNGYIHFKIATLYEALDDTKNALDFYSRAAKEVALQPSSLLRKSRLYALNKNYEMALQEALKALSVDDSSSTRSFVKQLKSIVEKH
jgi:tetratricopeptide (TPR) repeat protein